MQTRLAVGYGDGRVYVWDLSFLSPSFGQVLQEDGSSSEPSALPLRDEAVRLQIPLMCVSFHQGPCNCLVYEPQQQFLVSGGGDGQVKFWDAHTLQAKFTLPGNPSGEVTTVTLPRKFLRSSKRWKRTKGAGGVVIATYANRASKSNALWGWMT